MVVMMIVQLPLLAPHLTPSIFLFTPSHHHLSLLTPLTPSSPRQPYNHKSDIWALGCVLYEMCALRQPFHALSFDRLVDKILQATYDPLPK